MVEIHSVTKSLSPAQQSLWEPAGIFSGVCISAQHQGSLALKFLFTTHLVGEKKITLVVPRLHFQGWLTRAISLETADRFPLHASAKQWAEAAWSSALEDAQGPGRRRWLIRNGSPGPWSRNSFPAWWELLWNHSWVQSFSSPHTHALEILFLFLALLLVFVFVFVCGRWDSRINFMASQVLNFESDCVNMLENLIPLVDKIQNYLYIWGIIR